ncbi:hypothetical protein HHK36_021073 [Tetracentron sinense]|uniref:O-fucosyltransferase family protein n=1 Tax=Tetracentron sinense TaxID=13715 RepID=A0A834YP39_TETSI|nr:hypothetical protein HHK36_021073 [Tetracentron sinense]
MLLNVYLISHEKICHKTELKSSRNFQEIYDVEKFLKSLDGVVRVTKDQPAEVSTGKLAVVRVPNRVTEDHIAEHIESIFRKRGNLRLATYFPSVNMRKREENKYLDSVACLAMFGTLDLQPEVHEVVDSMVGRLRTLSRKSDGHFIAVDLRVEILEKAACQGSGGAGRKSCYNAQEIGVFLRKIGFNRDTTIYLTQSSWHSSLDALKDIFPKTYTKDVVKSSDQVSFGIRRGSRTAVILTPCPCTIFSGIPLVDYRDWKFQQEGILPGDKKAKFLNSGSNEFEKAIDFYICSQSDVFVPAISGLFYANVAGKRVASGRSQILVPAQIDGPSASASNFISPYVSKKNHMAYSCFC